MLAPSKLQVTNPEAMRLSCIHFLSINGDVWYWEKEHYSNVASEMSTSDFDDYIVQNT